MPINKDNLLQRLADGDEQALKVIFDNYHGKLLQIAVQILHSHELAEETVMDTFTGLWEKRRDLPRIANLSWYLYTMVKNKSLNGLRTLKSKPYVFLDDIEVTIAWDASPEDLLMSSEELDRINHAISSLPPKCKQIFIMVKEEQLKYREVAELLQVSIKTVENQMGIALKKIHDAIDSSP